MAAATISVEQEQFSCSVCLEVWREPVTIPCGHSYCLDCIQDYWNRSKQKGHYSCPQCRQVFNPRPLLSRNTVLGEVVEKFQRGGGGRSPAADHQDEVKCSVCTSKSSRAVRRCDACQESLCAAHCKVHQERFRGKSHKLVPAGPPPADMCPQHHKTMRLFCRTDRRGVCSQCVRETHKGHTTVPVEEERATQQSKLKDGSLKSEQKLKDMEKELRYIIRYIKHSAQAVTEESERIFTRLIWSIQKRGQQVKELIRVQERAAVDQAEELLAGLHKDAEELRRNQAELERLCHSEDHLHFLQQKSQSLHFPVKSVEMPDTDALQYIMYKSTREGVADLRDTMDQTLQRELSKVSEKLILLKENGNHTPTKTKAAKPTEVPYNSEPKSRMDFLHYYNDIILDRNTANPYLCFADGGRVVYTRSEPQPYPQHPDRFTNWAQVLCKAGMAGRCYWEVKWDGEGGVSIGVCYKNMSRGGGGSDSKLGHNLKSWSLDCNDWGFLFQHNKESVSITARRCSKVGVYLDFRAGTLSFYQVSDTMVLLHRVQTTFTQPVHPGFWVGLGSSLTLCSS